MKAHAPLLAATIAIIITLIACTALLIHELRHLAFVASEVNIIRHTLQESHPR